MAVSKKAITKKDMKIKYIFGISIILLGIIFDLTNVGVNEYAGFQTLGSWLVFTGILVLILAFAMKRKRYNRIIDERAEKIGYKSLQITNAIAILTLFAVMIIDGITVITIRYYLSASWLLCYFVIVHLISYKIIERKN